MNEFMPPNLVRYLCNVAIFSPHFWHSVGEGAPVSRLQYQHNRAVIKSGDIYVKYSLNVRGTTSIAYIKNK
jgi:hypothetical protein